MPVTCKVDCPRCSEPIELEVALTIGDTSGNDDGARFVEVKGSLVEGVMLERVGEHMKVCQNA